MQQRLERHDDRGITTVQLDNRDSGHGCGGIREDLGVGSHGAALVDLCRAPSVKIHLVGDAVLTVASHRCTADMRMSIEFRSVSGNRTRNVG